ncbi:MAG: anhydro-N-acetylmuramic acid kinase [Herminiimonas sp.]|nr:anhydro-N-acetylmuramic acid kinase [Herminiimonas sp.]
MRSSSGSLFIGLMSGTSLDGVDGVLASLPGPGMPGSASTMTSAFIAFPENLRAELMALQTAGENEIQREALAGNALAEIFSQCVMLLLAQADLQADSIAAIGVHGQTIRHRPELGFTWQTGNPALLAELTGIDVVADFRSRDIAAGGQGAPLVPAFHQAVFGDASERRVVANIGGIANISVLMRNDEAPIVGFDTGPGNMLMDAWIATHQSLAYDDRGHWAASGRIVPDLLASLRRDPYFALPPPKSTGRDLFDAAWLIRQLAPFPLVSPVDVQATLAAFTATTLADAIVRHAPDARGVYVCGGGAYNTHLLTELQMALASLGSAAMVSATDVLGVPPNHVEALAFAWLAQRFIHRLPGNLASVTGARGLRILGALYPA